MNNKPEVFDEKAEDKAKDQAECDQLPLPPQEQQSTSAQTEQESSTHELRPVHSTNSFTTIANTLSNASSESENVNLMDVDSPAKDYIKMLDEIELEPLSTYAPEEIFSSCVQMMAHQQLDRDTLHTIMRVLVRPTKDYNMAEVFARFGGIDVLLNMKQNSGFIGFTPLATLLIRHVIEEPKNSVARNSERFG
jgi:E3 ubiquitin-protein ligase HUWE1